MNPKNTLWMAAALALALLPTPASAEPSSCHNYGMVVQVGLANSYECHAQYCDQGTGAGAGAGTGGPGQNQAGAEASAGTSCSQTDGQSDPVEAVGSIVQRVVD